MSGCSRNRTRDKDRDRDKDSEKMLEPHHNPDRGILMFDSQNDIQVHLSKAEQDATSVAEFPMGEDNATEANHIS